MDNSQSEVQPGLNDSSHADSLHDGISDSVKQIEPISEEGETKPGMEAAPIVSDPAQPVDESLYQKLFGGWLGQGSSGLGLRDLVGRLKKKNPGSELKEVKKAA